MAEHDGDKSQEATPHRRQQAREEGQVPQSHDLASAALLLLGLVALMMLGGGLVDLLGRYFKQQLGGAPWLAADTEFTVAHWHSTVFALGRGLLPLFGVMFVAGIAANLFQVGFLFLPEKLMPDITRLDPLQGMRRIFSLTNFTKLVFGLLKMILIAAVAYASLRGERERILGLAGLDLPQLAVYLPDILLWCGIKIAGALLLLAILDYGFQRWKHERDLRMTPQEVREEMKNLEGNPQVAARRRQLHREMAKNRLSDAVPKADVVITNPTELAIALQYDPDTMVAPIVVAKGAGLIAQRIRRLALDHGIPIVEKKPLAQALFREVDAGHPIPQDKYSAVAEVLAYVYQLKGKKIPSPRNAA